MAIASDDEPDAPREQDLLLVVQHVMYRDRAYQTWQDLATWLDQPTRELFVAWAREVAAARSMPPALVQLPEL